MPRTLTVAASMYQAALLVYPPEFRREFGDQMARDFEEANSEAWRETRWRGVIALWAHTFADLVSSVLVQWPKSRLPAIGVASAAFATLSVSAAGQLRRVALPTPITEGDRDLITVMLMIMVVLMIVAAILVFNLWFSRSLVRRLPTHRRF